MRLYLETQIAARRQRLAAVEHERSTLLAEIRAYEDALAHATKGSTEGSPGSIRRATPKGPSQQGLNLSPTWTAILRRLADFKRFNAGEIMLVARELHKQQDAIKEQSPANVRSQLSLYAKRGIIMRLGGGNYRLSDDTKTTLTASRSATDGRSHAELHPEEFGPELPALAQSAGDAR